MVYFLWLLRIFIKTALEEAETSALSSIGTSATIAKNDIAAAGDLEETSVIDHIRAISKEEESALTASGNTARQALAEAETLALSSIEVAVQDALRRIAEASTDIPSAGMLAHYWDGRHGSADVWPDLIGKADLISIPQKYGSVIYNADDHYYTAQGEGAYGLMLSAERYPALASPGSCTVVVADTTSEIGNYGALFLQGETNPQRHLIRYRSSTGTYLMSTAGDIPSPRGRHVLICQISEDGTSYGYIYTADGRSACQKRHAPAFTEARIAILGVRANTDSDASSTAQVHAVAHYNTTMNDTQMLAIRDWAFRTFFKA